MAKLLLKIVANPDEIRVDKEDNRYLFVKKIREKGNRPYVVCVELKKDLVIIITAFPSDEKYLSNFDLLWRTGA